MSAMPSVQRQTLTPSLSLAFAHPVMGEQARTAHDYLDRLEFVGLCRPSVAAVDYIRQVPTQIPSTSTSSLPTSASDASTLPGPHWTITLQDFVDCGSTCDVFRAMLQTPDGTVVVVAKLTVAMGNTIDSILIDRLTRESGAYARLAHLQGRQVARFFGLWRASTTHLQLGECRASLTGVCSDLKVYVYVSLVEDVGTSLGVLAKGDRTKVQAYTDTIEDLYMAASDADVVTADGLSLDNVFTRTRTQVLNEHPTSDDLAQLCLAGFTDALAPEDQGYAGMELCNRWWMDEAFHINEFN